MIARMFRNRVAWLWLACFALALPAQAETRAWLDRDRIAFGETATLNIETDQASAQSPDFDALLPDFVVSNRSSSRSFELDNGQRKTRTSAAAGGKIDTDIVLFLALEVGIQFLTGAFGQFKHGSSSIFQV